MDVSYSFQVTVRVTVRVTVTVTVTDGDLRTPGPRQDLKLALWRKGRRMILVDSQPSVTSSWRAAAAPHHAGEVRTVLARGSAFPMRSTTGLGTMGTLHIVLKNKRSNSNSNDQFISEVLGYCSVLK